MTTDRLIDLLRASRADAWEITDTQTEGWEFYFIRHRLDQNRARNVQHIKLRVFRLLEDGAGMGSATAQIEPTAGEEETRELIDKLTEDARYAVNPPWKLNRPAEVTGTLPAFDLSAMAEAYLTAMRDVPETDTEDLNSYEIFVNRHTERFINSEGIDISQIYPEATLETVVNARNSEREIELYDLHNAGDCDREAVMREVSEMMRYGRDRLCAVPTPPLGTADVLFSTRDAVELYKWFAARMDAAYKYQQLSDWEIGSSYEIREGDPVTLLARACLPGSSGNRLIDAEGAVVRDLVLIDAGVPVRFWGAGQFRSYLGGEDGYLVRNFEVKGGTAAEEELRQGSYLEVVEFSDFSVDDVTGDIAGEIRLGYWHDKGRVTPVTGGSVSGSLRGSAADMRLSSEQRQYDNWVIPHLTRIPGLHVTGIETPGT